MPCACILKWFYVLRGCLDFPNCLRCFQNLFVRNCHARCVGDVIVKFPPFFFPIFFPPFVTRLILVEGIGGLCLLQGPHSWLVIPIWFNSFIRYKA